jgi:hypothetical protein
MSRCLHYLYFSARIRSASTLSHLRIVCMIGNVINSQMQIHASFYSSFQPHCVSFVSGSFLRKKVRTGLHVRNDLTVGDRHNVVAMASRYGFGGAGIESRWEARFSVPVQTGPPFYRASCNGYPVFPAGKAAGAWC